MNRLAVALAHFDIDLSVRGTNELKLVRPICFLSAPVQLRRKPANKEKSGRSESVGVIKPDLFDFSKTMMRGRMIEELRERETNLVQSRPIQVAEDDALFCLCLRGVHETHLRLKIAPWLAVVDDSIDPRPKLRIHRLAKFVLPPKRRIRIQVRENNIR